MYLSCNLDNEFFRFLSHAKVPNCRIDHRGDLRLLFPDLHCTPFQPQFVRSSCQIYKNEQMENTRAAPSYPPLILPQVVVFPHFRSRLLTLNTFDICIQLSQNTTPFHKRRHSFNTWVIYVLSVFLSVFSISVKMSQDPAKYSITLVPWGLCCCGQSTGVSSAKQMTGIAFSGGRSSGLDGSVAWVVWLARELFVPVGQTSRLSVFSFGMSVGTCECAFLFIFLINKSRRYWSFTEWTGRRPHPGGSVGWTKWTRSNS